MIHLSEKRRVLFGVVGVLLILSVLAGGITTGALIADYRNLGTLTRVISLVNNYYIGNVNTNEMINGAIKGVVDSLGDPYSVYMPPKMYKELTEQVQGSFGGIGILVGQDKEHIYVVRPIKETPASRAGIKEDDIIYKIDGKDTKGIDMDTAVNKMRGKIGTDVTLTIFRPSDKKMHDYKLTREIIKVPSVEGKMLPDTDIAYIAIMQFSVNTDEQLEKELREMKLVTSNGESPGAKGLILDLRGNPGGELDAAVRVADMLVPKGTIVSVDYKSQNEDVYRADDNYLNMPMVVLVDGNSASASEIVAGAIKDRKTGTLVGTKTFGKGVVQSLYELQNSAGLKLTTGRYLTPLRHDINKKGIDPDVKVEQPDNADKDIQLEKAIEVLKSKMK
ncbi:MAG TPA: S41 family peptidase [Desulfobacteria bacterium]|nr:S41 family peptidase [Desulfobacteria bacterium]